MEYAYHDAAATHANGYIWPALLKEIGENHWSSKKAFDLGCGNGATSNLLQTMGFDVTGIDPSESGIWHAQKSYPNVKFSVASAYDELAERFGQFDLVYSLEVVEHCYDPRRFANAMLSLMAPGALGIVSTPYHGYLKNLALALSGNMDRHFTALWDGGHIKFFSINTLGTLLREAGAKDVTFVRVGRIPVLAKSMLAIFRKNP